MYSTDAGRRADFITGLRQLADYLDANPGIPVPRYGTKILLIAAPAEHGGVAEIEALAELFGAPVDIDPESLDRFATHRQFGPISYEAVSHAAALMALHHALWSYEGCVTPDD
jgi:hypothetical protein